MKRSMAVIIPAYNKDNFLRLLDSILKNTVQPDRLVIINNSRLDLLNPKPVTPFTMTIMNRIPPAGINASWRTGFKFAGAYDLITVLDDNVTLAKDFFAKLKAADAECPTTYAFCPSIDKIAKPESGQKAEALHFMNEQPKANVFMLRSHCLVDLPMIPAELTTYCGLDWIWFWTVKVWQKKWIKVPGALAFNHSAADIDKEQQDLMKSERELFDLIISDL